MGASERRKSAERFDAAIAEAERALLDWLNAGGSARLGVGVVVAKIGLADPRLSKALTSAGLPKRFRLPAKPERCTLHWFDRRRG